MVTETSFADQTKKLDGKRGGSVKALRGSKGITVVGTVTGALQGTVRVGEREIVVTEHTLIYKTDRGRLGTGARVVESPVYATCVKHDGKLVARLLIVSDSKTAGRKAEVTVVGPDAVW